MEQREFEIEVGRIRPRLHHEAMRYVSDEADAEDIAQEVVLKLWVMHDWLDEYRSIEALAVAMLAGGHSPAEWLAVGSGMGYYSISSVLITGYRGTELGTIALLSNIVREMIALLGAALLVRLFGTLAPIAAAGATAMDTTLPVISRTCGPRLVPVSIYCGMATDFSVPFLVTLFCSM